MCIRDSTNTTRILTVSTLQFNTPICKNEQFEVMCTIVSDIKIFDIENSAVFCQYFGFTVSVLSTHFFFLTHRSI